jgi:hypothetical protein
MANRFTLPWYEKEEKLLYNLYPTEPMEEIERKLPRHSKLAIYQKAFVMGLKRIKNRGAEER